jgi:predicted rRNA methylase YqxC with S4 and FtsJ domains
MKKAGFCRFCRVGKASVPTALKTARKLAAELLRIMDLIKPNFEEGGVGDMVPHKGATPP